MPTIQDLMGRGPVRVILDDGRALQFRYLGYGGLAMLPWNRAEASGEDAVCRFLAGELADPSLGSNEFRALSDADYLRVLTEYASAELGGEVRQDNRETATDSFQALAGAVRVDHLETAKAARDAMLSAAKVRLEPLTSEFKRIAASMGDQNRSDWVRIANDVAGVGSLFSAKDTYRAMLTSDVANATHLIQSFSGGVLDEIQKASKAITAVAIPKIDFKSLLPDFRSAELFKQFQAIVEHQEQIRKGREKLDASDLTFANHLWEDETLVELAKLPAGNAPKVGRLIVAETRERGFEQQLLGLLLEVTFAAHRHKIVRQAMVAHRRRMYHVSVPTLFAQIEGIVTDTLVHLGTVIRVGRKVRHSTKTRLNKNGVQMPVELKGLHDKTLELNMGNDPTFSAVGEYLVSRICSTRNGALHGTDVDYGTAEESARAVLVLAVVLQLAKQSMES